MLYCLSSAMYFNTLEAAPFRSVLNSTDSQTAQSAAYLSPFLNANLSSNQPKSNKIELRLDLGEEKERLYTKMSERVYHRMASSRLQCTVIHASCSRLMLQNC